MSIAATNWAFAFKLPPRQKLVLLALADYADSKGVCWPSSQMLSEKTGLSRRTVQYALSAFRKVGLIVGGGGRGATSEMRLALGVTSISEDQIEEIKSTAFHRERSAPADKRCAPAAQEDVHVGALRSAPADKRCARSLAYIDNHQEPPRTVNNHRIENQSEIRAPKTDPDVEFETFWSAYPRKNAKANARKAYTKARKAISAEKLLAAVNAWPFPEPSERGDFRPYAASWLNAERWEDESVQHAMQAQAEREQFPAAQIAAHEEACRKWRASGFDGPKPKIEQFAMEIA